MGAFGLIVTAVVMLGVVVAILLFERQRADEIRHDVGEDARERLRDGNGSGNGNGTAGSAEGPTDRRS